MAITRSSNFLRSPTEVPTNTSTLLNSIEGKVDENVLNVFKALVRDLNEYKQSMYGITRRFDNMMFLYNSPTGKQTDVMEAARMDKNGNIAVGTEYPDWLRSKIDVGGIVHAEAVTGSWRQNINIPGIGLYTWDVEEQNSHSPLYFERAAGNTRIKINCNGTYLILAQGAWEGSVTFFDGIVLLEINGVARREGFWFPTVANTLGLVATTPIAYITPLVVGDLVSLELSTGATRLGAATGRSNIMITKLN